MSPASSDLTLWVGIGAWAWIAALFLIARYRNR